MARRSSGWWLVFNGTAAVVATLPLLVPGHAEAMCPSGRLWASWPPSGTTIPTNPHIILEGYGAETGVVDTIDRWRPTLVGPAGDVPLRVVERNVGGFVLTRLSDGDPGLVQVVLAPTRELPPGCRWELHVDGADHLATWTTMAERDRVRPRWSSRPLVGETFYLRHGCVDLGE